MPRDPAITPEGLQEKERKKPRRKPRVVKSRLLMDMRWVYEHPEGPDKPRHQTARNWLDMDPRGFLTRLSALETSYSSRQVAQENALAKKKQPSLPDHKTAELTDMIDRTLQEWEQHADV